MYRGMAGPEHTLHLHTQARGTNGAKKLFTPPKQAAAYFYPGNVGGAEHDHTP